MMRAGALLEDAKRTRTNLEDAKAAHRYSTIAYMRAALENGASWTDIGNALGVTDTAARRYYDRNKGGE